MKKNEAALRWDETKKRLRLEGRIVLDRLLNEVLAEASEEFDQAQLRGELMEVPDSREKVQDYFRRSLARVVGGTRALPKQK